MLMGCKGRSTSCRRSDRKGHNMSQSCGPVATLPGVSPDRQGRTSREVSVAFSYRPNNTRPMPAVGEVALPPTAGARSSRHLFVAGAQPQLGRAEEA